MCTAMLGRSAFVRGIWLARTISALRMQHRVEQVCAGQAPTDHIDPTRLTRLTRRYLKEAFQAVGRVQRGIEVRMGLRLG